MSIKPADEEVVREAERSVNKVWQTWRAQYDDKTSKEVLAMAAFQFAKLFFTLQHSVDARQKILDGFEAELDRLLRLTASAGRQA